MVELAGPHHPPRSGGAPDSLVVLLHGRGSSGDDLIGLADMFADGLPGTAFYSPDAPHPFAEGGFGYQWYSPRTNEDRISGLLSVAPTVNAYVDELIAEHGIEPTRVILLGFSQGAMVSLHTVPRREVGLAGVVAFSGAMATADTLKAEIANKTPMLLVHGAEDPVLPARGTETAAALLTELGVPTELYVLDGLGHSIDRRGIEAASAFMKRALDPE